MRLPGFLQRIWDRFNTEVGLGHVHGWHQAQHAAVGHGSGSPLWQARRWLDEAGQRLDHLMARAEAGRAPAGRLGRLGRAVAAPARWYTATGLALSYATANAMGWQDGHRARALAPTGPGTVPSFTGSHASAGTGSGTAAASHEARASAMSQPAAGRSAAAATGRQAAGSQRAATVGRLSFAAPATQVPAQRPAETSPVALPAAPSRRAITSGRSR